MFQSILFCKQHDAPSCSEKPCCFRDLNLDQLVDSILKREKNSALSALYYSPLQDLDEIQYRQDFLRDLMPEDIWKIWDRFSQEIYSLNECMKIAREDLFSGDPWKCNYLLYGHFLDYGERYCQAIGQLRKKISETQFQSEGMRQTIRSIELLCNSDFYRQLQQTLASLREKFNQIQYCMLIRNGTIRVKKYESEENLSEQITNIFKKFQREDGKNYLQKFSEVPHADHVEAGVLQCLSHIYPELFNELEDYVRQFSDFMDQGLLRFCCEIQFYLSWLKIISRERECGLPFCFPEFGTADLFANGIYDITLAGKIGSHVVKNDFYLHAPERILVITGPNQGGKTTFARAIGQVHYLASLGLCVPGISARLLLPDRVLTHFEREEVLTGLNGKLEDDLQRLHELLQMTTSRSLVIINEIFASTVLKDAECLGKHMMEALTQKGACCVIVTFLVRLAQYSKETVSMVSTVDPASPEIRTFKVIRKPPDGLAYAMTRAAKYGLTHDQILRRISP